MTIADMNTNVTTIPGRTINAPRPPAPTTAPSSPPTSDARSIEQRDRLDATAEIDEALITRATRDFLAAEDVQLTFAIEQQGALGLASAIAALRGPNDPRVTELRALGERARVANRAADPYLSWLRGVPVIGALAEKRPNERDRLEFQKRRFLRGLAESAKHFHDALGAK